MKDLSTLPAEVQKRKRIERRIVRRVLKDGKAAGYKFNIDNGGDGFELASPTDNIKLLMDELFATDDEHLHFYKDGRRVGWVYFIYVNSGWDVISDYTNNLDPILKGANDLADTLCD